MDNQDIRTLKILEEIGTDNVPSQRELARKLNVSLGLVNSFVKRLAQKGYFKVTTIPKCRFDATVCGAEYVTDPVVRSGNLICARGKKDMSPWMQEFASMIEDCLAGKKATPESGETK